MSSTALAITDSGLRRPPRVRRGVRRAGRSSRITRMPSGTPNMYSQACAITLDQRWVATCANRAETVSVSMAGTATAPAA